MNKKFLLLILGLSLSATICSMEPAPMKSGMEKSLRELLKRKKYMILESHYPDFSFDALLDDVKLTQGTLSEEKQEIEGTASEEKQKKIAYTKFKVVNFNPFFQKIQEIRKNDYDQGFREGFFSARSNYYVKVEHGKAIQVTDPDKTPAVARKLLQLQAEEQQHRGQDKDEESQQTVKSPEQKASWLSFLTSRPCIALYAIIGTTAVCHYDLIQKFLFKR